MTKPKAKPIRGWRFAQGDPRRRIFSSDQLAKLAERICINDKRGQFDAELEATAREYLAARNDGPSAKQINAALENLQQRCGQLIDALDSLDDRTRVLIDCAANEAPRELDEPSAVDLSFIGEQRVEACRNQVYHLNRYIETAQQDGKALNMRGRPKGDLARAFFIGRLITIWEGVTGKKAGRSVRVEHPTQQDREGGSVVDFVRVVFEIVDPESSTGIEDEIRKALAMG